MFLLQNSISVVIVIITLLFEVIFMHHEKIDYFKNNNAYNSIKIFALYLLSNLGSKIMLLFFYEWVSNYRLLEIENNLQSCLILFFLNDLIYYSFHRASHCINWFWTSHFVHHSSDEFNIISGLRLPWTSQFTGQFLFWIWLPFIGFNPLMVIFIYNVTLVYQLWLHTEIISKLPKSFEFIFNTPSHHRVHHGCDLKYMDKNMGGVLIIWDRLFGTFQEEEERPSYGLAHPTKSNNPFIITTIEWINLFKRVTHSGSLRNAINYIIQPPGWSHDGSTKTIKQLLKEAK